MEKKPFHEQVEDKKPQGIKGIFAHAINTLWNTDQSNQNFQECLIYLENAADDYEKQVEALAFKSINDNREIIEAGFTKVLNSSDYQFENLSIKTRYLTYNPFNQTYTLYDNADDENFICSFKQKRAKSAIYFANNIL